MRSVGCREWLWKALCLLVITAGLSLFVRYGGPDLWDWYARRAQQRRWAAGYEDRMAGYRASPDPLLQALATGEVGPGYPADVIAAAHPPTRTYQHGPYLHLSYDEQAVTVVAKTGRLIGAWRDAEVGRERFWDPLVRMSLADQASWTKSYNSAGTVQGVLGDPAARDVAGGVAGPAAALDPALWEKVARPVGEEESGP